MRINLRAATYWTLGNGGVAVVEGVTREDKSECLEKRAFLAIKMAVIKKP
jgi:hypothetical protein